MGLIFLLKSIFGTNILSKSFHFERIFRSDQIIKPIKEVNSHLHLLFLFQIDLIPYRIEFKGYDSWADSWLYFWGTKCIKKEREGEIDPPPTQLPWQRTYLIIFVITTRKLIKIYKYNELKTSRLRRNNAWDCSSWPGIPLKQIYKGIHSKQCVWH